MSRKAFKDFVHTAEHSYSLRVKLKSCSDSKSIINLANEYGFCITKNDLTEDYVAEKVDQLFNQNVIAPIKIK